MATFAPSPNGTRRTSAWGAPIFDGNGNAWTLVQSASNGLQIAVNGVVDAATANVTLLETLNGAMVQENAAGSWRSKTQHNASWVQIANPNAPSPSGIEITSAGAPPIFDGNGNAWTLVQLASNRLQIAVNGVVDAATANVTLLETLNGAMVQENAAGSWYSKTQPADSWVQIADPNPASPSPSGTMTAADTIAPSPSGTMTTALSAAPSQTATLLFESDFGGTTAMSNPPRIAGNALSGSWQIVGGDDGFTWPITLYGEQSQLGLQPISYGPTLSWDPTNQVIDAGGVPTWKASIVQGVRHDGTIGPMLYQQNFQNILWQMPYVINPGTDATDLDIKVWMKLPSDAISSLGPNDWRALLEWKDAAYISPGTGYRIAVYIYTDANGNPYWFMHGDDDPSSNGYWYQSNKTAPVPVNQWFELDWSWHRTHDNTSWTSVKLNGTTILQQNGEGSDPTGFYNPAEPTSPINRILLSSLYGGKGASSAWVDHIEIWNGVPSSAPPSPPVANPDIATTMENQAVAISVLANDTDASGTINPASVAIKTAPAHGTTSVNPTTGVVSYTPANGFVGTDTLQYTVADTLGDVSAPASVTVTVSAPLPPIANADTATTMENQAVAISVLANDTDASGTINPASVAIKTAPAHGTTSVNPTTGVVTYTPADGFVGTDTLQYTVADTLGDVSAPASVTVTVSAPLPPIANADTATTMENQAVAISVLANDTDASGTINPASVAIKTAPAHGTTSVNPTTGVVTYTPANGFVGTDTLQYTVADTLGDVSAPASVTVTVSAPLPPIANADTATTMENQARRHQCAGQRHGCQRHDQSGFSRDQDRARPRHDLGQSDHRRGNLYTGRWLRRHRHIPVCGCGHPGRRLGASQRHGQRRRKQPAAEPERHDDHLAIQPADLGCQWQRLVAGAVGIERAADRGQRHR